MKIQPLLPYYRCASGTYRLNFRENSLVNGVLSVLQAYAKSDTYAQRFFLPLASQLPPLNCQLSTINCQLSTLSVSALCQRVSPFQTLHALYLSGLCQRVSLICKNLMYVFSANRHPLFIVNAGIVFAIAVGRQVSESAIRCELTDSEARPPTGQNN